jgi:hypothetical protein
LKLISLLAQNAANFNLLNFREKDENFSQVKVFIFQPNGNFSSKYDLWDQMRIQNLFWPLFFIKLYGWFIWNFSWNLFLQHVFALFYCKSWLLFFVILRIVLKCVQNIFWFCDEFWNWRGLSNCNFFNNLLLLTQS